MSFNHDYAAIGRVAHLWNEVEHRWFVLFNILAHELPAAKTSCIFLQFQNSNLQRRLVRSLAEALVQDEKLTADLKGISKRTDELAIIRNAAIHGRYFATGDKLWQLQVSPGHGRKKNPLAGRNFKQEMEYLQEELRSLLLKLTAVQADLVAHLFPEGSPELQRRLEELSPP